MGRDISCVICSTSLPRQLTGRAIARCAIAATLTLCAPLYAAAQTTPAVKTAAAASPAKKAPDVSKEALVFDKLITRIREERDGTETRETTARVRILADAGVKAMAVLTFTYTASNQQVDIGYVRVIKPDGSVVITPSFNIQDLPADVTREGPMYSDIHQKHVAVRGLGVGDTLEYQLTLHTTKPDVPGQFWLEYTFQKNLIMLDEEIDLDVPADKPVTVASADVQPTVTTANGRKLYHWVSSNLSRPDPDAPPKSTKHWKPSVQVTTFSSWQQIGDWYASLQKEPLTVTPAIQARADALTKGLTSDEEKVRAIFNDVALHIHYVALEFGIGRYQPHSADDVLANQYGDCKDKHTLLATMLKAAGIQAWPVLISSSRELDPATPSPAQFDHVITVVPLNGKLLWMDSTEEVAPVGVLAGTLRDKQALAIPAGNEPRLERTPTDLPFAQSATVQVDGKLTDQGLFTAHFKETYHGDSELLMRGAFRSVPQSQWKELLQGLSNATGFAGEVKNPDVSPVEQTAQPLQFSYDYTREKFGQWDDRRISPPLPPVGWELVPGVKQIKPADDIDTGGRGDQTYTAVVQLPSGWLLLPPQSTDLVEPWAEYHASYSFKDGTFTAVRRLQVKNDHVPIVDWDRYLAFRRGIFEDESRMEGLMNSGTAPKADGSVSVDLGGLSGIRAEMMEAMLPLRDVVPPLIAEPPASGDALTKSAASARDVVDALESRSTNLPSGDFNSLYWTQALATGWCVRGWTALEANDLPTAENYLRAAWSLSQDQVSGYLLGRVLEAKHEKLAAAHQYELAHVTGARSIFGGLGPWDDDIRQRIQDAYKRVTGKPLTATGLNHGAYAGSLQAELDKRTEIKPFLRSTKLTGDGYYEIVFETGKPVSVSPLSGDKGFDSLLPILRAHSFATELPAGSKARLLREVHVICSPWAGCDAYILLASAPSLPSKPVHVIQVKAPEAPGAPKTLRVVKVPQ